MHQPGDEPKQQRSPSPQAAGSDAGLAAPSSATPASAPPVAGGLATAPGRRRFPVVRRLLRRLRPRSQAAAPPNMLPVLIEVFAGFSQIDGVVEEGEIDSSLSALRHEFPETVYSELRRRYREALEAKADLNELAKSLADTLAPDDKLLLGAQLYALISQSGRLNEHLIPFYLFMTNLGVASEAIDLVYQLNTGEIKNQAQPGGTGKGGGPTPDPATRPLESLHVGRSAPADLVLAVLPEGYDMLAFRFGRLVLLKNTGSRPFVARGRVIPPGGFTQIYGGQRVLLGETVLSYSELVAYFNAKNDVATTRVYLSFRWDGNAFVEKAPSKDSHLEIDFGLGVKVKALRATEAQISGKRLRAGTVTDASLTDRIVLANGTEISLAELRRRARELGGRFELHPSKYLYTASTDPTQLDPGDILLSQNTAGGEVTLRIRCDFDAKSGELEVVQSDLPVHLEDDNTPVRSKAALRDGDVIRIGEAQYLSCDFGERIIEEQRNLIGDLDAVELRHSYDGKETALDGVTFSARRGEMIGIIGPSGCGKSTLIRALAGHLKPQGGHVEINGHSLYDNHRALTPYISYIPQEEAFDPLLTVEENIDCAAAIRCPHLSAAERRKRADTRLADLGLSERRHRLAGSAETKILSGGERKRLNAGLDMISVAEVYLFDEPTSGLSSKDSEHVMEIIRGLSQNKITFVSIHQPSSRLFHMFQKVLLLDRGGKVAFFGTPSDMLEYFREARAEERAAGPLEDAFAEITPVNLQPDFVFDVLETPLRDLSGNIVYEEDAAGHYIPARRFLPDFWADRFQTHRLLQEVRESKLESAREPGAAPRPLPAPPKRGAEHAALHLVTHLKRSFLSKLRNRANLYTTLLEAPALALLIATVLRYSEDGDYTFAAAFHIPTYLFLSLVVALFLGLTNSADEIIRDRGMLARERGHGIRVWRYIAGKFSSLAVFALAQCVIYITVGNLVLGIHQMFWHYLLWMALTSLAGVATGLFISSVVKDSKTALNIIPLILIPQIILGGALIKYEEMNSNLDFVYSVRKWMAKDDDGQPEKPSELKVPAICEVMPLRWSYEAMVIAQDKLNPLARSQDELEAEIRTLAEIEELSDDQLARLNAAKDALALVSGLEAETRRGVHRRLKRIREELAEGTFDIGDYPAPDPELDPVSSIDLYQNQKIRDLVAKAEMETGDYRLYEDQPDRTPPNVFFGLAKHYFGREVVTLRANFLAMVGFIALALCALAFSLRWQLRRV